MALGLGRLDEEGEFGGNATASDTASLRSYGAKSKARQVKVDFTVVQQDCDYVISCGAKELTQPRILCLVLSYSFQARDSKEHIARTLRDGQGQARPDLGGGLFSEARGAQVRLQRALRRPGKSENHSSQAGRILIVQLCLCTPNSSPPPWQECDPW